MLYAPAVERNCLPLRLRDYGWQGMGMVARLAQTVACWPLGGQQAVARPLLGNGQWRC
jgi:hypothetical protein